MKELFDNFQGYLQLNIPNIKWIILFGFAFCVLFMSMGKKNWVKHDGNFVKSIICVSLLSLSCSFIFVMTLFRRSIGAEFDFRSKPFESYYIAFAEGGIEVMLQIIINIVMFIPIGFLLPCCFRMYEKYRYVLITALIASVAIELLQLIFRIGLFETDDVINNVFGTMMGLGIYVMCTRLRRRNNDKQKK